MMITKNTLEQKQTDGSNSIEELAVFSKCTVYDNKLSTIAEKIEFVHLSFVPPAPPIDETKILDVAISEKYIFLLGVYDILQYDRNGKFIRKIGRRGQGPQEYIRLTSFQLDEQNDLIFATDIAGQKIQVFDFNGKYVKKIPLDFRDGHIEIISPSLIAIRQGMSHRYYPGSHVIKFIDTDGKHVKTYLSNIYPIDRSKIEHNGPDVSYFWRNNERLYSLEYGSDTIFRIEKDVLIPDRVLTGKLKLDKKELFQKKVGQKLNITSYVMLPNAAIFESSGFTIFKLSSSTESFYMVYNKSTKKFHRTYYGNAPVSRQDLKKMDYFTDDLISGLSFNPHYQSKGNAVALISAMTICEKKKDILDFISKHPTEEGKKMQSIVRNMDEEDNAVIMIVKFK